MDKAIKKTEKVIETVWKATDGLQAFQEAVYEIEISPKGEVKRTKKNICFWIILEQYWSIRWGLQERM